MNFHKSESRFFYACYDANNHNDCGVSVSHKSEGTSPEHGVKRVEVVEEKETKAEHTGNSSVCSGGENINLPHYM